MGQGHMCDVDHRMFVIVWLLSVQKQSFYHVIVSLLFDKDIGMQSWCLNKEFIGFMV